MKNLIVFLVFFILYSTTWSQDSKHIQYIKNNLEVLAADNAAYNETLKLEVNVANATLPNFLIAVSKIHQLNLSVASDISNITIINNFANVTIKDLLLFLCKEYNLTIDFTGSILAIKRYKAPLPVPVEKEAEIDFDPVSNLISVDISNISLEKVFRKIMEVSGKNLLYNNNLKNHALNGFLNNVPFDIAMEKLAALNGLNYSKSRDGFYLFSTNQAKNKLNQTQRLGQGIHYEVLDTVNKLLNVDFQNSKIAFIVESISRDLNLDVYTATPLEAAGSVTFNAKGIYFDDLLTHIFESQYTSSPVLLTQENQTNSRNRITQKPTNSNNTKSFTFKKQNNIYFFGTVNQLSLRKVEIIQMMHRSVELLSDPSHQTQGMRKAGRTNQGGINYYGGTNTNSFQNNTQGNLNNSRRNLSTQNGQFNTYNTNAEALVNILPDELTADLDIKIDLELNSFLVSGPAAKIERFKAFIKEIDKPIPVVLIEVMIIEVRNTAIVETGVSWGIGDKPTKTIGNLYPTTDLTLGANTINKVIGGFDGFGSFNIGKVVPEFFATIKAMEENGNIKIRSTPKLSTLNGHRANLSIGETTYYVVTNQNFFGSQIPTSSEVRNYVPIDAELGVSIKPLVSGDGQVTLDINVIQSDFSGERIEEDAPPGLTSREFSSIIRMQNQDLAVLGGLEEKIKNDSGSGVPLLARVPVIKWLFSKRKREKTTQKLTILIKPTVIY
jgi:type IV pilus assembly protein PilQ